MRFDLQVIASWITPGSRVLDLGCGSGDLLQYLKSARDCRGAGIEKREDKVGQCIAKGLSVLHGDIAEEVGDYPDACFDYVILSQTLQQVYEPTGLIREILRIGRYGVVSFPNFSHIGVRAQLFFGGRAPVSKELPYGWHDTPNIRVITIKDFRKFCAANSVRVARAAALSTHHLKPTGRIISFMPNLFGAYGLFMLEKAPPE